MRTCGGFLFWTPMSNLSPFKFQDSVEIRTLTNDNGEVLFVGKDVAIALGYADHTNAIKLHCRGVAKHHPILDSLGRTQEARVLTEADVLRLIVNSKLPAAEAFERWVFEEVLPTIRKTGSYSAPKSPPSSMEASAATLWMLSEQIAKVPGVKPGIAAAAALSAIQANTGLDMSEFRKILPAATHPIRSMNATKVGAALGKTAAATNALLCKAGLQQRNDRNEWELTKEGEKWAEALPYTNRGHSGYQILWNPSVVDYIAGTVIAA